MGMERLVGRSLWGFVYSDLKMWKNLRRLSQFAERRLGLMRKAFKQIMLLDMERLSLLKFL